MNVLLLSAAHNMASQTKTEMARKITKSDRPPHFCRDVVVGRPVTLVRLVSMARIDGLFVTDNHGI